MALSDFQQKKFMHVFAKFYDLNGDGVIDWQDFAQDIDKLSKLLGWADGSDARKKAESTLKLIWEDLRKNADKNKDDVISKDEWLKMWGKCVTEHSTTKKLPDWVFKYMEFMFTVNDGNGDDVIDLDEYTQVFTQYGLSPDQCKDAFNTITNNGAIRLTLEEYNHLWTEYFTTNDPAARGNALFGKI